MRIAVLGTVKNDPLAAKTNLKLADFLGLWIQASEACWKNEVAPPNDIPPKEMATDGKVLKRFQNVEIVEYNTAETLEVPSDEILHTIDGVIMPGSASSANDPDQFIEVLRNFIVHKIIPLQIPTLGVCFGHQVIATAIGGVVGLNPLGRILGYRTFPMSEAGRSLLSPFLRRPACCILTDKYYFPSAADNHSQTQSDASTSTTPCTAPTSFDSADNEKLKSELKNSVALLYSHDDIVTSIPNHIVDAEGVESIPVKSLGGSPACPVAGIAIGDPPFVVSFQGHPEFSTPEGIWVSEQLVELCLSKGKITKEEAEAATNSFDLPNHSFDIGVAVLHLFRSQMSRRSEERCKPAAKSVIPSSAMMMMNKVVPANRSN